MRILVVYTNTYSYLSPTPIGASLVAARLRRAGHEVRFVDLMFAKDPVRTAVEAAREHRPELTCFSIRNRDNMMPDAYFDPIPLIMRIIAGVREACPVPSLLGGTAFTTYPARLLRATGAEWGIAGDDLEPIAAFVASVAAGAPDLSTPGLAYRRDAEVVENPFVIAGYRDVTFDNLDLIDFARYRRGYWQAGVVTRTGCAEPCVFCDTYHTFGKRFVLREPKDVAADLLRLKQTGKVRSAFLVDAGFNRPLEHAKEVLREIIRQGAQLQLYSVFDPGHCDEEFLALYRRAGGVMVVVFAESLSDPVLKTLGKTFMFNDVQRDTAALRRAGVVFMLSPILGGPGETKDTVKETLTRAHEIGATYVDFGIGLRVQPRTKLHDIAVQERRIAADDDGWEPTFYVAEATPKAWLQKEIRRYKLRNIMDLWRTLPMMGRMMFDAPWRRGPEAVD